MYFGFVPFGFLPTRPLVNHSAPATTYLQNVSHSRSSFEQLIQSFSCQKTQNVMSKAMFYIHIAIVIFREYPTRNELSAGCMVLFN